MIWLVVVGVVTAACGTGAVCADAPVTAPSVERPQIGATPWHLVDLWWDFGDEVSFESLEIDVDVRHEPPNDVRLYIAPIGLAHISKTPFYGGLQTQADGYTKNDPRLRGIGRGLLMSMWGERDHDAIRPSAGGYFQSSGHEGDFVSVRRPFQWSKGHYTYRVAKMDRDKESTWVGAFLYSRVTEENIFVGALRFPSADLKLAPQVANFVEIYGPAIRVEDIPRIDIVFGSVRINGEEWLPRAVSAHYPPDIPDVANAKMVRDNTQVLVTVGDGWIERTKRDQVLYATGRGQ
ncbi:hypothetical protein OAS39_06295 [Pirellulales bacterium]|nr:hypothetical protein [Pirellulales bacterium]